MWIDISNLPKYTSNLLFKFKAGAIGLGYTYDNRANIYSNGADEDIYFWSDRFQDLEAFCHVDDVKKLLESNSK